MICNHLKFSLFYSIISTLINSITCTFNPNDFITQFNNLHNSATNNGDNRNYVDILGFDDYIFGIAYIGSDNKVYASFVDNGIIRFYNYF